MCANLGELLPGNSRDDTAHLRTYVPVLDENRAAHLDSSCCHSEMPRSIGR